MAWGRRPQAAALVAQLADPDRGWDAIVIGEYERAFYGGQYAAMAPLFEHYGVQLWMPEAGGRVDFASEHDEQAMTVLGLSSKREVTRTSIRVRTAMAAQTREQGRYLGGRPPYGYRLAMRGRTRTRRTPPGAGGRTAWSPTRRRRMWCGGCSRSGWRGTSVARIARALNERGCRARRRPTRTGTRTAPAPRGRSARWPRSWQPAVHRPPGVEPAAHRLRAGRPRQRRAWDTRPVQRWNLPDGWVISARPAHPALVSEADFIAAQDINAARGPRPAASPACPAAQYLLAGLLACGTCGRRMESAWSNGKPAYRCPTATPARAPDPGRAKNAYIREDRLLSSCLPCTCFSPPRLRGPPPKPRRNRRQAGGGPGSGDQLPA